MRGRSGFGWGEFVTGLCMILLGGFTFVRPASMFTGLAILYGIVAVVTGVCDILFFIKAERYTGLGPIVSLISGILSTMAGVTLLAHPGAGRWIASLVFPLWFITHCISRLASLGVIRITAGRFYYCFSLVVNIVGIALGFLMLFEPVLAYVTAGYFIAFYLILFGIDSIVLAFSDIGARW